MERDSDHKKFRSRNADNFLELTVAAVLVALLVVSACGTPAPSKIGAVAERDAAAERFQVSALGRLEPGNGVVDVGGLPTERVERLLVSEGDDVAIGVALAILDSFSERRAEEGILLTEVGRASLELQLARELGPIEAAAIEAEVRVLEAGLNLEESKLARSSALQELGIEAIGFRDHQVASAERARGLLDQARLDLARLQRKQVLEVQQAEVELELAKQELERARVSLARSEIRSPLAGRVLKVFTWPGEVIGNQAILRMGEVEHMFAVAEVHETDIRQVKAGQRAEISSPAFPERLLGTVETVGAIVFKNDILDVDPTADSDLRVIEVRIRLDDSRVASGFVQHQVRVDIRTTSPGANESAEPESL